ncbi:dihydroflavonol 4-reductase-like [Telopea speciosissima]|uniref:dihydroflavonol 4-reductase-like n=1 Tax=Telopea speciosissima TaxID=54955 RepID=UPI001CC5D267|nr:dihydroflavonol 4-reductase-like [Telopea speciosissima]
MAIMGFDDHEERGTVCVTGAAGFVGSWLVMKLLRRGYFVNATVRDPGNVNKVKHLLDLPHAETRLKLWKADLVDEGSFDGAIQGCTGVFHVATPMDFESKDPENEVIKPAVNGMLNIMRSSLKAKTVRRIVFTSSAGTVNVQERQLPNYDESSWSDLEFIRKTKMTGWMYFVSKVLSEKAAWEFAEQNNMDLITIIPTLVVGPFITPSMPPSLITALAPITGNEAHYSILKQVQFVHLDDLCNAHIFLFENPESKGRYICSSDKSTIIDLAKMLREKFPEYNVPTEFNYPGESLEVVDFSSKKLTELGFEFKYSLEDMYMGAIESAKEKGLLSPSNPTKVNGKSSNAKPNSEETEKINGIKEELKRGAVEIGN